MKNEEFLIGDFDLERFVSEYSTVHGGRSFIVVIIVFVIIIIMTTSSCTSNNLLQSLLPLVSTQSDDVSLLENPVVRGGLFFQRETRSGHGGPSDDLLVLA